MSSQWESDLARLNASIDGIEEINAAMKVKLDNTEKVVTEITVEIKKLLEYIESKLDKPNAQCP